MLFITYVYQHTINGNGDWDGYDTQWSITADTLEEAEKKLWSMVNMHTETSGIDEFMCPINRKFYPIEMYEKILPIIKKFEKRKAKENAIKQELLDKAQKAYERHLNSLEKASLATRATFLEREMPFYMACQFVA